ncbi:hypothetical protein MASR1M65_18840 [Saprospiraceae bacterium]
MGYEVAEPDACIADRKIGWGGSNGDVLAAKIAQGSRHVYGGCDEDDGASGAVTADVSAGFLACVEDRIEQAYACSVG